jgi:hypothetical protein
LLAAAAEEVEAEVVALAVAVDSAAVALAEAVGSPEAAGSLEALAQRQIRRTAEVLP